jgi:hypothetical protein
LTIKTRLVALATGAATIAAVLTFSATGSSATVNQDGSVDCSTSTTVSIVNTSSQNRRVQCDLSPTPVDVQPFASPSATDSSVWGLAATPAILRQPTASPAGAVPTAVPGNRTIGVRSPGENGGQTPQTINAGESLVVARDRLVQAVSGVQFAALVSANNTRIKVTALRVFASGATSPIGTPVTTSALSRSSTPVTQDFTASSFGLTSLVADGFRIEAVSGAFQISTADTSAPFQLDLTMDTTGTARGTVGGGQSISIPEGGLESGTCQNVYPATVAKIVNPADDSFILVLDINSTPVVVNNTSETFQTCLLDWYGYFPADSGRIEVLNKELSTSLGDLRLCTAGPLVPTSTDLRDLICQENGLVNGTASAISNPFRPGTVGSGIVYADGLVVPDDPPMKTFN